MFDTAVTLKYGEGNWKWYEQVELNEKYHHAKFDIYHFHGVWVNPNFNVSTSPNTWPMKKHVNYLPWIHISRTNHIVHNLFNVYSNHIMCQLQGQESKNKQFAANISNTLKQSQDHKT